MTLAGRTEGLQGSGEREMYEQELLLQFLVVDGVVCTPIQGGYEVGHLTKVSYVLYQLCFPRSPSGKGAKRSPVSHACTHTRSLSGNGVARSPVSHACTHTRSLRGKGAPRSPVSRACTHTRPLSGKGATRPPVSQACTHTRSRCPTRSRSGRCTKRSPVSRACTHTLSRWRPRMHAHAHTAEKTGRREPFVVHDLFTSAGGYKPGVTLMTYGALLNVFTDIGCNGFPDIVKDLDVVVEGIWDYVTSSTPLLVV